MCGICDFLQRSSYELENTLEQLSKENYSHDLSVKYPLQSLIIKYLESSSSSFDNSPLEDKQSPVSCHDHHKYQEVLIRIFLRNVSWYSIGSLQRGITKFLLNIFLSITSLDPQYLRIFLACVLRITSSLLQNQNEFESLIRGNLFLITLRDLISMYPMFSDRQLQEYLETELLQQIENYLSSCQEIFICRLFMVLSCVKVVWRCRPTLDFVPMLNRIWSLLRNYPHFHSQIKESLTKKKFLAIYNKDLNLKVFLRIAQKFADGFSDLDDLESREASKISLLWNLELTNSYTSADETLLNPLFCSSPPVAISDLPHGSSATKEETKEFLGWLLSEYNDWIQLVSSTQQILSLFWRRLFHWTLQFGNSLGVTLGKQLLLKLPYLTLRMKDSSDLLQSTVQDTSSQFLKPLLLILFHHSPSKFFQSVIRSWLNSIEIATTNLLPLSFLELESLSRIPYELTIDFSSRSLVTEPIPHLRILLNSCHLISCFLSHTNFSSQSFLIFSIDKLSSLLLLLLIAIRQVFSVISFPIIDSRQTHTKLSDPLLSLLQAVSLVGNHLVYILICSSSQISSSLKSHLRLRDTLLTIFDSICENYDSQQSAVPFSEVSNFSYLIPLLHPLLTSYLRALVLPSFGFSIDQSPHAHSSLDSFLSPFNAAKHSSLLRSLDLTKFPELFATPEWQAFNQGIVTQWIVDNKQFPNLPSILSSKKSIKSYLSHFQEIIEINSRQPHDEEHEEDYEEDHLVNHRTHASQFRRKLFSSTHPTFLSYDICLLIMEFVSVKRVCRLACVNTVFRAASQCMELWKHKYILRWPLRFDLKTKSFPATATAAAEEKEKSSSLCQPTRCPSCYPPLGKKIPVKRKPCPPNFVLHNWQQLYKVCLSPYPYSYHSSHLISPKEKAIASRKCAAAGGGSTVRSICEVVGCITMLRNEDCRQVFPLLLPPLPLLQLDSFFFCLETFGKTFSLIRKNIRILR
jgi:hypothetical protein